jgi:hypothetical protein
MFAEQSRAPMVIRSRSVGPGFGQYFDPVAYGVDGHQAQTDQPAKTMHAWITVTSAPGRRHRKPNFVGYSHAVHRLQQQIQIEAKLHFHDRKPLWLAVLHGDYIAAVYLALHLKARRFQEALHGRIERGLKHAAKPVTPFRAAATGRTPHRETEGHRSCRLPGRRDAWGSIASSVPSRAGRALAVVNSQRQPAMTAAAGGTAEATRQLRAGAAALRAGR